MKFIDWSSPVQLYSQIAGGLAGIIFVCITLFLARAREQNEAGHLNKGADPILMLLTSALWSFIAAAFLYAEATGHVPKKEFAQTLIVPADYQGFNLLAVLGAIAFATSIAQTFLCLCYLFEEHCAGHDLAKFAGFVVTAVVLVIVTQMTATVEYAIRLRTGHSLDSVSAHIFSVGAALLLPVLASPLARKVFGGRKDGLIQLAYGSMVLSIMAAITPTTFSSLTGVIPENVYVAICYCFTACLGVILSQCLACRPAVPPAALNPADTHAITLREVIPSTKDGSDAGNRLGTAAQATTEANGTLGTLRTPTP